MRLLLQTRISNRTPAEVFQKFDKTLFLQLAPPFPRSELVRFDGCKQGDMVGLRLRMLFRWHVWWSEIIADTHSVNEESFVDLGIQLPFFLSYWKHAHRIVKQGNDLLVVDDIEFKAHNFLLTWLSYPAMYVMFAYRKPLYKRLL